MINYFKNFLNKNDFDILKNVILGYNFPWYFSEKTYEKDNDFQFVHLFYNENEIKSNYFYLIEPILIKLNCKKILRIKANLTTKQKSSYVFGFHNDVNEDCITSIFYLNSNNGKTVFEKNISYKSEENCMISFPSNLKHSGTTHTDEKIRVVLNLNYSV